VHFAWLVGFAALALRGAPAPQDPAPTGDQPVLVEPRLREEFFELTLEPQGGANPAPAGATVGVLAWRHRSEPVEQLEWEITLPRDEARVLHVEHLAAHGPQMIWRELRPGGGRTLTIEWGSESSELKALEWGRGETVRHRIAAPDGGMLPLFVLELARRGELRDGEFCVFDPLSLSLEPLALATRYYAVESGRELPVVEAANLSFELRRAFTLTRQDGSLAGEYIFRGDELASFRWQAGGLSGRRITRSEYRERIDRAASQR
jgi:hypothetical protein